MKAFFDFRENRYNIRKFQEIRQQKIGTVQYGRETALYRARQPWSPVSADLKSLPNVNLFKSKTKHWECTKCPCKLCKTDLKDLGYLFFSYLIKHFNKVMAKASTFICKFFSIRFFFKVLSGVHSGLPQNI